MRVQMEESQAMIKLRVHSCRLIYERGDEALQGGSLAR
jgi:hypothetical protein